MPQRTTPPRSGAVLDSRASRVRLTARSAELERISEMLATVRDGQGAITIVEGRAGFGKSRLLQEAAAVAVRAGVRVGIGAAHENDRLVPMAALFEALFEGSAPLLDPADLQRPDAVLEHRSWLLQELQNQLERASLHTPLLVCLDDLQWADTGTAVALRALPERLSDLPIGWLVASRTPATSPELRSCYELLRRSGAHTIVLNELDDGSVAELVADFFGADPDPELLTLARRAGGSPFLLVELLSGLAEEALVHIERGRAELRDARLPARFRGTMRDRLARLSPAARRAVTVASVLGRRFSVDSIAAMLSGTASDMLLPVEELLERDLLAQEGEALAFRHDLLQDYVEVCGALLARAHSQSPAAAAITGYLGKSDRFDRAVTGWAVACADQTERDHHAVRAAIKSGRIAAEQGV